MLRWLCFLTGVCACLNFGIAEEFGQPAGDPTVWDFTTSVPDGGVLRKGAKIENGLAPTTLDVSVPVGFEIQTRGGLELPAAFRFDAEFTVAADDAHRVNVLWDNMYVTYKSEPDAPYHRGFQVAIQDCGGNRWQAVGYFGFGTSTECIYGPRVTIEPGQEVRLKFFYDANRTVFWDFAGETLQSTLASAGALAKSRYNPCIGDRFGSNYCAFNGVVKRVALTSCKRSPLGIVIDGSGAFERGTKGANVRILAANFIDAPVSDIRVTVAQDDAEGKALNKFSKSFEQIEGGGAANVEFPVQTCVRPGWYAIVVRVEGKDAEGADFVTEKTLKIGIGPKFADRFPALIWMYNNRPLPEVLDFGFTHGLTSFGSETPEVSSNQKNAANTLLDQALVEGFRLVKTVRPYYPAGEPKENFARTRRDGTVPVDSKGNIQPEVSHPQMQEYAREVAAANASAFGLHPAMGGVLPNSEIRDGTFPSFRSEPGQYKAQTGREIPEEITGKTFNIAAAEKRFPDGVVPDDDPILEYYRWFWSGGDGWPDYNSGIAQEYRKVAGRYQDGSEQQNARPFFSFFDPAVRVPARWGSGGDVDILSQWVYAVPEPLAVAGPAEELITMAAGRPKQDVMIMTQIICYRAQIAPKTVTVAPMPQWVLDKPDADFPTIPPDSLQEATWAMIAKPVQGIMYHGYACIAETGAMKGYTYTNSETPGRMRHLMKNVVAPLGPTLKRLPREDSPVAVLESFTTTALTNRGTWGWITPDLTFFQRSRLDPRVIYEETILRDGFGNARVLYAPQCSFLPKTIVEKIREFQAKGGILVADEQLTPALKADILVPVNRVVRPALDSTEEMDKLAKTWVNEKAQEVTAGAKAQSLADIAAFRQQLDSRYLPAADSSSPELITFNRRWGDVPYLFVINDHRTFGDYVGQWGMTMEKGLPFAGDVTLADPEKRVAAVYELSRGGEIPFDRTEDGKKVRVPLNFDTNDGRLLMFLEKKIAAVTLDAPKSVERGGVCRVKFRVLDEDGTPISALLPVEIRMFDASGAELDGGGYACAENGECTLEFQLNLNDAPGSYKIQCRDRASGLEKTCEVKISAR